MTKMRAVLGVLVASAALCLAFVPGLRAADTDGTPWLGVYTQRLTDDLRAGLSYNGNGVLVSRVVRDSPADRAGVRKGDVITRVDGREVVSSDALADMIQARKVGDRISVRVVRDRSSQELKATLTARDDEEDRPRRFRVYTDDGDDFDFDFDRDISIDVPKIKEMVRVAGRGRLGVRIESLNEQLGEYFQVRGGKGALVLEVIEDSPAEKAGIRAGDVITKLGSNDIDDAGDLTRAVGLEGGKVRVTLVRHGDTRTVEAELEDAPRVMKWSLDPDHRVMLREHARELREHARGLRDDAHELRDDARIRRRVVLEDRDELREALRELREELREMKRELEEMRDDD